MTGTHFPCARLLVLLALFVSVPALAGCVEAPNAADAPEADAEGGGAPHAEATVLPWGLTACRFVIAVANVPEDGLRERLPEGYEPRGAGVAPFAPLAAPYLAMEAFACESAAGLEGPVLQAAYGSWYTAVEPPAAHAAPEAAIHFVKWDALVADDGLRERMQAVGMPARTGAVEVPESIPARGDAVAAALTLEGVGTARFEGVASLLGTGGDPFPFAEYTPRQDGGVARWEAIADPGDAVAQGHGVLRFPPGSWPAEVAGADALPARFIAGTYTFRDGTLLLDTGGG